METTVRDARADPIGSRCLWQSEVVRVGELVAPPRHPVFRDDGPIAGCNVVFPHTRLRLRWTDGDRHCSDPAVINFYNDGDGVQRTGDDPAGDHCSWLEIQPSLLETVAERLRARSSARPFRRHQAPSNPPTYLRMRRLVAALREEPHPDTLWVEETAVAILDVALRALGSARPAKTTGASTERVRRVEASRELLSTRFTEPVSLHDIARAVGSSPFHLARGFRLVTGITLHQYRMRLRLHHAIERLLDGESDLSALAHDLGFSSHSHFSAAFRRHVGRTPSSVRTPGAGPAQPA